MEPQNQPDINSEVIIPEQVTPSSQPFWRRHLMLSMVAIGSIGFLTVGPLAILLLVIFSITAFKNLVTEAHAQHKRNAAAISVFKVLSAVGLAAVLAIGAIFAFSILLLAGMSATGSGESS